MEARKYLRYALLILSQNKQIPKVIAPIEEEKIFCVSFKVFGTKEQLIDLKKFLNDGGYKYE